MEYYAVVITISEDDKRLLFLEGKSSILQSKKITWKAPISETDYLTGIKNLGLNNKVIIQNE